MRVVIILCFVLGAGVGQAVSKTIGHLSLEDASAIGLKIETDAEIKAEGKGAVRITTSWPTSVCVGELPCRVEGGRLVYSVKIRTRLAGDAFLEMWVHAGGGKYFSRGVNDRAAGRCEWKTIRTIFFLQKGQKMEKATLNLVINGTGVVWVDDVVVNFEPLPATGPV